MSDDIADQLRDFWKMLDRQLKAKPTRDGIADVFGEHQHLAEAAEADADNDPAHRELLDRALAIQNAFEPWIPPEKVKGWKIRNR